MLMGVLLGGIAAYVMFSGGNGGDADNGKASKLKEQLSLTRTALAATENFKPDEAEELWAKLYEQFPDDKSVALNRALNRVLKVDELADTATNGNFSEEVRKAARLSISQAIDSAQTSIAEFQKLSSDSVTAAWLSSRVEAMQAMLLPRAYAKTIRREIFDSLTAEIEKSDAPKTVILGGPLIKAFDDLEDAIDGHPRDLELKATETVGKLSDKHPDNLFLAVRAARLALSTRDKNAASYVERTSKLASAISPLLSERTKPLGVTSVELVGQIIQLVKEEKWDDAYDKMTPFFNVLNPEEIIKTDRRRAGPHPLDRLSFESLRRLSAKVIEDEPIGKAAKSPTFDQKTLDGSESVVALAGIDFDLDLDPDLAVVTSQRNLELWKNDDGSFRKLDSIEIPVQATGVFVADLFEVDSSHPGRVKSSVPANANAEDLISSRHDTFPSIVIYGEEGIKLIAVDGRDEPDTKRLTIVERASGLESIRGVLDVSAGDLEGDGDLDLIVATRETGVRFFVNRGNRSFFEAKYPARELGSEDPVTELAIVDLDRDLDLDVVTVQGKSGTVGLLENLLHLQFRDRPLDVQPIAGATTLAIGDFDGNVSWDIAIGSETQASVTFSQTAEASVWTQERTETAQSNTLDALLGDFDNDSWQELISLNRPEATVSLLGPWGIDSQKTANVPAMSNAVTFDFNRDGQLDLAGVVDGKITVALNTTSSDMHFAAVRFRGQADNAANSGRVNHYGIGSILEMRFGPHYRAQVITNPATHFGMGAYEKAGSVRVIMPNGLTQTIREPAVDTVIEELQSLKGSCPYLYAWDGEKMAFVTDCLWAAPLGLQVANGVVAKDRPWEYLKVDGRFVKPRGDHYDLRITEELWEIAYIDHVALQAIDHPADVSVWTNEKVGPGEIATPTIFAFRDSELHPLTVAKDSRNRDVSELLREQDKQYVQAFRERYRQGLCPLHWIDVDFGGLVDSGKLDADSKAYLVLSGWIMPTDTSLNIQIDQNPDLPSMQFPSVWVPDSGSETGWKNAIPFMGFPGGKTKTIVVDVSDVIVRDDPRFRIQTSAQIYWDDARLALQTEPASYNVSETTLAEARLGFHGFSRASKADAKSPELYHYDQTQSEPKWPPLRGPLTAYGSCTEVVSGWDDQMVVMSGGDELQLRFDLVQTPIPEGWKRDFVLHCVGWDKDADLNTLTGQSTTPLPRRDMDRYPPTVNQNVHHQQVFQKNERYLRRTQSFRAFWRRTDLGDPHPFLGAPLEGYSTQPILSADISSK